MSIQIEHPYADLTGGQWLRGNLHTHTTRSDGQRPMGEVIDDYASRDYDFLMISDHDILTVEQDYATCDTKSMLLIPGNEISKNGVHMLHVGCDRLIEPDADRQKVIDAVRASCGFIIVNHPNWMDNFDHCPIESLQTWEGYLGLEIFNGTIGRLKGSPYATNKWDIMLSQGRNLWGYANDDHHQAVGDIALGWNMVYVKDRSVAAVVDALRQGQCYASTGVTITDIRVDGLQITLETSNAQRIIALREHGQRITISNDTTLQLDVPADARYVRFECWGQGEQFAWTQPFQLNHP